MWIELCRERPKFALIRGLINVYGWEKLKASYPPSDSWLPRRSFHPGSCLISSRILIGYSTHDLAARHLWRKFFGVKAREKSFCGFVQTWINNNRSSFSEHLPTGTQKLLSEDGPDFANRLLTDAEVLNSMPFKLRFSELQSERGFNGTRSAFKLCRAFADSTRCIFEISINS